jgi:predicted ester cyclase
MGWPWASLSPGSCSAKRAFTLYQEMVPDLRYTIEEMITEGDTVRDARHISRHAPGAFLGVPPTGKRAAMTWMGIDRIAGNQIAEHWAQLDNQGMLQQFGMISASGQAIG